jgi:hypothetical protein
LSLKASSAVYGIVVGRVGVSDNDSFVVLFVEAGEVAHFSDDSYQAPSAKWKRREILPRE